jgi:hypothetical protein
MSKVTGAGIGIALIFIILKCVYFITGIHYTNYNLIILTNVVCAMMAVGLGMYMARDKKGNFLTIGIERIKAGMRGGAIYTVIISLFVYFYYGSIDKKFFADKITERVHYAEQADFELLKTNNPEKLGNKSRGDFIDMEREQAELWFSPFMISTITMLGTLVTSMLYALVLNIIFKNFLNARRL